MAHLVQAYGYVAVFLLMAAESACIPIPSEVVMPLAGALTLGGQLSLLAVIALGLAGNLLGSFVAYVVGRTGGRALVSRLAQRRLIRSDDLDRAERWFNRRGAPAVAFGRLVPVVRTFISLPAGIGEMPIVRFGVYSLAGSLPFLAALAVAGRELGSHWRSVDTLFQGPTYVVAGAVVVSLAVVGVRWARKRRQA
jgi:membrane protein DedA with SNARE-associated domain